MRIVLQRVISASLIIDTQLHAAIEAGMLVFVGITADDTLDDIAWIVQKISQIRIFDDEQQVANKSINDIAGEVLLVSQFTLYASTKKGNRPSYIEAAKPEIAIPIYTQLIENLQLKLSQPLQTGVFGADMKITLCNDGPFTICLDSKNKH